MDTRVRLNRSSILSSNNSSYTFQPCARIAFNSGVVIGTSHGITIGGSIVFINANSSGKKIGILTITPVVVAPGTNGSNGPSTPPQK